LGICVSMTGDSRVCQLLTFRSWFSAYWFSRFRWLLFSFSSWFDQNRAVVLPSSSLTNAVFQRKATPVAATPRVFMWWPCSLSSSMWKPYSSFPGPFFTGTGSPNITEPSRSSLCSSSWAFCSSVTFGSIKRAHSIGPDLPLTILRRYKIDSPDLQPSTLDFFLPLCFRSLTGLISYVRNAVDDGNSCQVADECVRLAGWFARSRSFLAHASLDLRPSPVVIEFAALSSVF